MPDALKIFIISLITGVLGAYAALRVGTWLAERFFPREPMAFGVVVLATAAIGMASAVTSGVLMGRSKR